MLDKDWLESLDFTAEDGLRYHGLLGIGAEGVVLKATAPDGEELAAKTYRQVLGYHIREIPLILSGKPLYKLDRVNQKLRKLMGCPDLDEMTSEYHRMFSSVIQRLHDKFPSSGDAKTVASEMQMFIPLFGTRVTPLCPEALPFLLGTSFMKRRLEEIVSLPKGDDFLSKTPMINGPNFRLCMPIGITWCNGRKIS